MNNLLQRLMKEATRLTHSGQLQAATEAIQRALHGDSRATPGPVSPPAAPAPSAASGYGRPHTESNNSAVVIDGCIRVIDDLETEVAYVEPAEPQARTAEAPTRAPVENQPERWTDGSFTHQGRTLTYKLYVPPRAAGTAPKPGRWC